MRTSCIQILRTTLADLLEIEGVTRKKVQGLDLEVLTFESKGGKSSMGMTTMIKLKDAQNLDVKIISFVFCVN
jgi:hypothetical protein